METPETKTSNLSLKEIKEFLKEYEIIRAKDHFILRSITLVIASLGLITALAWEEAAKDIFILIFGGLENLDQKISYALITTLITVIVSIVLNKVFFKKK